LQNISRQSNSIRVSYEELKDDPAATIAKVYESLGLAPVPYSDDLGFNPNTSFAGSKKRSELSYSTKVFKNVVCVLLRLMPAGVPFRLWKFLRGNPPPSVLRGTFRVMDGDTEANLVANQ